MSTPNLDDQAVLGILVRYHRAYMERQRSDAARAAAEAECRAADIQLSNCIAGLRVFGFEVTEPNVWEGLTRRFASEIQRALAIPPAPLSGLKELELAVEQEDVSEIDEIFESLMSDLELPEMPSVKDIVLERLRAAGEAGTTARAIRQHISHTYKREVHDKTVGMTLHRLKSQGVRVEGRTWFLDPSSAEKRNPGGDTPGSVEDELFGRKEDA